MATTFKEQIEILKGRGMCIEDENIAEKVLADIGYNRLGFYWHPFAEGNKFKEGTSFESVTALYDFDDKLRNILWRYITGFEVNFRTAVVYYGSHAFSNFPDWFANTKCIKRSFANLMIRSGMYQRIRREPVIRKNEAEHPSDRYAPTWKVAEFMTFGEIRALFEAMQDDNAKKSVCHRYSVKRVSIFLNYLQAMNFLRNKCAHGSALFNLSTQFSIKNGPIKMNGHNSDIVGCLYVLRYLLSAIDMERGGAFEAEVRELVSAKRYADMDDVIGLLKDF